MRNNPTRLGWLGISLGFCMACSNGDDGSSAKPGASTMAGGNSSLNPNSHGTANATGGVGRLSRVADGGATETAAQAGGVGNGGGSGMVPSVGGNAPASSAPANGGNAAAGSGGNTQGVSTNKANGGAANAKGGNTQGPSTTKTNGGAAPSVGGAQSSAGGMTSTSGGVKSTVGGMTSAAGGTKSSVGGTSAGTTTMPSSAADCRKEGDGKTTLVFVNGCSKAVTYRGSDITGGTLAVGAFACVDVGTSTEALSSKRYWGWIGADPGAERHSLAEFTFNTDFYDMDWYNISYVDAHNLPLAILPAARPKCRQLICPQDFLVACPLVGQYRDADGNLASCVSPNRDDPQSPVALLFEQCDDAYAWSGDDQKGNDKSPMIGCEVEDFDIVFCPGAA